MTNSCQKSKILGGHHARFRNKACWKCCVLRKKFTVVCSGYTQNFEFRHLTMKLCSQVGGGGYSGFQVTGMIEGFFGFEVFDSGILLGENLAAIFFCVCGSIQVGFFMDIQNNLKILGSADCVVLLISCNPFWKF